MRKLFLLAVIFIFSAVTISAQFEVELNVGSTDPELGNSFGAALRTEFGKIRDVRQKPGGKFGLTVELIKRAVGTDTFDVFISTVRTSAEACIVGQDERGRVYSRRKYEEFLSSRSYVGRSNELDEIAKEIVGGFNGFVLEPLRNIDN